MKNDFNNIDLIIKIMLADLILFICIFFIYIHFLHEWKICETLELFETDYTDYYEFLSVCRLKQPFVCKYYLHNDVIFNINWNLLNDIHIYNQNDSSDVMGSYHTLLSLMDKGKFYTQHNHEAIVSSDIYDVLNANNEYIKPISNIQTSYDIYIGSKGVTTQLQYHNCSSMFLLGIQGSQVIRMFPWTSIQRDNIDFIHYEFTSNKDVWNDPIENMIEIELQKGQLMFVPPYWWYSCKHGDQSHLLSISYISLINSITHIPYKLQSFIQQQNVLPAYSVIQQNKIDRNLLSVESEEQEEHSDEDEDDNEDEDVISVDTKVGHVVQGTINDIIENIVDK